MSDTATLNAECNLSLSLQEAWLPAAFIIAFSIKAVCCLITLHYQSSVVLELQHWNYELKLHFHSGVQMRGGVLVLP